MAGPAEVTPHARAFALSPWPIRAARVGRRFLFRLCARSLRAGSAAAVRGLRRSVSPGSLALGAGCVDPIAVFLRVFFFSPGGLIFLEAGRRVS